MNNEGIPYILLVENQHEKCRKPYFKGNFLIDELNGNNAVKSQKSELVVQLEETFKESFQELLDICTTQKDQFIFPHDEGALDIGHLLALLSINREEYTARNALRLSLL